MGVPLLVIAGFLAAGTLAQPLARIMYALKSTGADGKTTTFQKPYFIELLMFVAMASLIALECVMACVFPPEEEKALEDLYREMDDAAAGELLDHDNSDLLQQDSKVDEDPVPSNARAYLLLSLPALCDLVATLCMLGGLAFVPASVAELLVGVVVGREREEREEEREEGLWHTCAARLAVQGRA